MEKISGHGDFGEILFEAIVRDDMKNSVLSFFLPKSKTEKGGPGSGHHDHTGLAGQWGGSDPSPDGEGGQGSPRAGSGGASQPKRSVAKPGGSVARPVSSGKISETHSVSYVDEEGADEARYDLQDSMVSLGILDKRAESIYGDLGDDQLNHAREMMAYSLMNERDVGEEGKYCCVVRDEKNRVVAASLFTRMDEQMDVWASEDPDSWDVSNERESVERYGRNNIYFDMVGSLTHGSGLLAIREALLMASDNNFGVVASSAHGDKFTSSMLERFGITKGESFDSDSALGGETKRYYREIHIPPESISKILALLERWI